MADGHGYTDTRGRDGKLRDIHDLPRLMDHLPLFFVVAIVHENIDVWDEIEGDLMRVDARMSSLSVQHLTRLLHELIDRGSTGAGNRLICVHYDAANRIYAVNRRQRHDHLDGGAVGIGNDALMPECF